MLILNTTLPFNDKPFRILSIDGGGLKGLVALSILEWIEKEIIKKSLYDCFDLFAGTSTGGIIACGLTVCEHNETTKSRYTVGDLKKAYFDHANKIFPVYSKIQKRIKLVESYFSAKYSEDGLQNILDFFFDQKRLSDCTKPILIPTYDVERLTPIYFNSRRINQSSNGYINDPHANIKLIDLCRATSAAPTYLPSYRFVHVDDSDNRYNANCIDGGVFLNNPAMAAYTEVLSNSNDPIYTNHPGNKYKIKEEDIFILSIGTGKTQRNAIPRKINSWGKLKWVNPIIKIMMEGNADSTHYQLKGLARNRYLRIDIDIDEKFSEMDDSRRETLEYLLKEVESQIINNQQWLHQLNSFKNIANL